jgi:phospholipase/carboxylesterase
MSRIEGGREPAQDPPAGTHPDLRRGRLSARHGPQPQAAPPQGVRRLGLDGRRDGLLLVPPLAAREAVPLLVLLLHGAGGDAAGMLRLLEPQARAAGIALLVPESRKATWDVIMGEFGPDVAFLDAALSHAFALLPVDAARLAIGGFSDGASYALTLGLANGDLFGWVLAFSPGFAAPPATIGRPRIFVSHGTEDNVLPIGHCSRRIVPRLQRAGYTVRYAEFEGGHKLPARIAADALDWLCAG